MGCGGHVMWGSCEVGGSYNVRGHVMWGSYDVGGHIM